MNPDPILSVFTRYLSWEDSGIEHDVTYMKLLTEGVKRHLIPLDQATDGATTLCGCTITHADRWKLIAALEGDECEKCADLTFRAPPNGRPGAAQTAR